MKTFEQACAQTAERFALLGWKIANKKLTAAAITLSVVYGVDWMAAYGNLLNEWRGYQGNR